MINPYYQEDGITIYNADCREVMKGLPTNSIDTIITDPPYGLEFMGKKWDYDVPSVEVWSEALRVTKPGGTALIFAGSRTQHRMAVNVEDAGWILKDCIMWIYGSGFPKATDISKQLDKRGDKYSEYKNEPDKTCYETEPATPEAKLWNGWKSHGLKPSYEPILVAMKPNDGTYASNALKWGVSGLNIDGGRIDGVPPSVPQPKFNTTGSIYQMKTGMGRNGKMSSAKGRYPANVILDEEAGRLLDEQSGELKSGAILLHHKTHESQNRSMSGKNYARGPKFSPPSSGGASRFFYCVKASKNERNWGCDGLEAVKTNDGKKKECDSAYQRGKTLRKNNHPTVKPLKLMKYLCRITETPTGGIVLDPFMGSGTTILACKNTGRQAIGIELDEYNEGYCNIAIARLRQGVLNF